MFELDGCNEEAAASIGTQIRPNTETIVVDHIFILGDMTEKIRKSYIHEDEMRRKKEAQVFRCRVTERERPDEERDLMDMRLP